MVTQRMLGFVVSTICLPEESLAHKILKIRTKTDYLRRVIKIYQDLHSELNLPDLAKFQLGDPC